MRLRKREIGRFTKRALVFALLICLFMGAIAMAAAETGESGNEAAEAPVNVQAETQEQPAPPTDAQQTNDAAITQAEATASTDTASPVNHETAQDATIAQEPPSEEDHKQTEVLNQSNEEARLVMEARSKKKAATRLGKLTYLKGGMEIPFLAQGNYKMKIARYDNKPISVKSSGSGAASMSMVICYLTGNTRQTPYTLMYDAVSEGFFNGGEMGRDALNRMAEKYEIQYQWIGADADQIKEALQAGNPVIALVGEGTFADGDHYIVLRGVSKDGKIFVSDPASKARSKKAYALSTIIKESETKKPFMICWAKDMPQRKTVEEAALEPVVEPTPELVAEPTPEPVVEPTPEPVAEPTPEPVVEPTPEPDVESALEPVEPTQATVVESTPEPVTKPTPEPVVEPTPEPDVESALEPVEPTQAIVVESTPGPDVAATTETVTEQGEADGYTVSVMVVDVDKRFMVVDVDKRFKAGDEVTLMAVVQGTVESPQYRWQYALVEDPDTWVDIEAAIGETFTFIIDDNNCRNLWRVVVSAG